MPTPTPTSRGVGRGDHSLCPRSSRSRKRWRNCNDGQVLSVYTTKKNTHSVPLVGVPEGAAEDFEQSPSAALRSSHPTEELAGAADVVGTASDLRQHVSSRPDQRNAKSGPGATESGRQPRKQNQMPPSTTSEINDQSETRTPRILAPITTRQSRTTPHQRPYVTHDTHQSRRRRLQRRRAHQPPKIAHHSPRNRRRRRRRHRRSARRRPRV
jgi:hypothetical protein